MWFLNKIWIHLQLFVRGVKKIFYKCYKASVKLEYDDWQSHEDWNLKQFKG